MSTSTDPITIAAQSIWSVLESHQPLTALVRLGNRIKFDSDSLDPEKAEVSSADLPMLRVAPISWTATDQGGARATSSSRFLTVTFGVTIATDKLRTGDPAGVYPIMWETLVAIWKVQNVAPGSPSIRRLWAEGGDFQIAEESPDGVKGWATLAQVHVTLVLNNQSLGIDP